MKYNLISNTDLKVSLICLGTMNWGEQNTENEAHQQMDYAISQGINFFDTAEIYPIPPHAESQGRTETYIGNWLKKNKNRQDIIIASKVVSRSGLTYARNGKVPRLDKKNIKTAIESSLKRLQTDYIDLYQLHWPDRKTNYFGQRGYVHDPKDKPVLIEETLEALQDHIKQGKIRYIGVSNETAWGVSEYIRLSREKNLPRIVSIQNPYSLIMREYETALAEFSHREQIDLLVYSPLSMGVLSGKYLGGKLPPGSRFHYNSRNKDRYNPEHVQPTVQAYVDLAKQHNLDPAQMALAFVNSRPFVTSNIIGATSITQLKANIESINIKLSDEVLKKINNIHSTSPNPIT